MDAGFADPSHADHEFEPPDRTRNIVTTHLQAAEREEDGDAPMLFCRPPCRNDHVISAARGISAFHQEQRDPRGPVCVAANGWWPRRKPAVGDVLKMPIGRQNAQHRMAKFQRRRSPQGLSIGRFTGGRSVTRFLPPSKSRSAGQERGSITGLDSNATLWARSVWARHGRSLPDRGNGRSRACWVAGQRVPSQRR